MKQGGEKVKRDNEQVKVNVASTRHQRKNLSLSIVWANLMRSVESFCMEISQRRFLKRRTNLKKKDVYEGLTGAEIKLEEIKLWQSCGSKLARSSHQS